MHTYKVFIVDVQKNLKQYIIIYTINKNLNKYNNDFSQ